MNEKNKKLLSEGKYLEVFTDEICLKIVKQIKADHFSGSTKEELIIKDVMMKETRSYFQKSVSYAYAIASKNHYREFDVNDYDQVENIFLGAGALVKLAAAQSSLVLNIQSCITGEPIQINKLEKICEGTIWCTWCWVILFLTESIINSNNEEMKAVYKEMLSNVVAHADDDKDREIKRYANSIVKVLN